MLISGSANRALTKSYVGVSCVWQGVWIRTYLAVVKCAVNSQVVNVGVEDRGHLRFLNRADLALRVHDEDRDILLSTQTVNSS